MDLKDILQTDEVKYLLRQKELKWKHHYQNAYIQKYAGFYHNYALHWICHIEAFHSIKDNYGITMAQFEMLMAHHLIMSMWNLPYSGHDTVKQQFLEHRMTRNTYNLHMKTLSRNNFISRTTMRKIPSVHRDLVKALKSPGERIYKESSRGSGLVIMYNSQMSVLMNKAFKSNPLLFGKHTDIMKSLIKNLESLTSHG